MEIEMNQSFSYTRNNLYARDEFKESISRIAFILPLRALYYVHTLTLCVVGHVY